MPYVTARRELALRAGTPADVLSRVRDGLLRRGRRIDLATDDGIRFGGGWALAWRTSQKPIRGSVQLEHRADGLFALVSIRDAAVSAQLVMLGFERRRYQAVIDQELAEIQMDVERD